MNIKDNNLDVNYEFAVNHASQIGEECNSIATNYPTSSPLYKKSDTWGIIKDIISFIVGLGLALIAIASINTYNPFVIGKMSFPSGYITVLLFGTASVFLFTSVFSLYKVIMMKKAKRDAKAVNSLAINIGMETKKLPDFDKQVREAMASGKDLIIEPKDFWQTKLNEHKRIVGEKSLKDGKTNQIIHTAAASSLLLFALVFFLKFIVGGYMFKYGTASGPIVAIAYLLIAIILGESLLRLVNWYGVKAKMMAAAIFSVYQMIVVFCLLFGKAFSTISSSLSTGNGGNVFKVIVFNYPLLTILLFTLAVAFIIFKPDYSESYRKTKEKFIVPMDDGSTRDDTPRSPTTMIRRKCIYKIPIFIAMGVWMANIINAGSSFWNIVLYIVIMVIYFGITFTMDLSDSFSAIYGEIPKHYRRLIFVCYVTVVLSLVPNFGFGTVVLLAIHMLGSLGGRAVEATT